MTKKKSAAYTPAPRVKDPELLSRYDLVLKALSGQVSVSEAARLAGLSRNRFQSLMHRAQAQLLSELSKKPAGRPAKPTKLRQLEARNRQLEKRTEHLERRMAQQEQILRVASELIQDPESSMPYTPRRTRRVRTKPTAPDDDEPAMLLAQVQRLIELGLDRKLAAALAGRGPSTLRRWARRARLGRPISAGRAPAGAELGTSNSKRVTDLVRESRGLMGAAALARAIPGVSRRLAARVKAETLTALERERKAAAGRIRVLAPGVLRGFDGLYLLVGSNKRWVLGAGDGAVPYRTLLKLVEHYDEAAVAAALDEDFCRFGAPLVLRLDRAKAHDAPEVQAVCQRHGVLVLHGPPHHPCYYGQLERQNREHRAWLESAACHDETQVVSELERMRVILNSVWPRRSLGWRTAEDVWLKRPQITLNRDEFRDDVAALTERIAASLGASAYAGLAERLAIETALTRRGLLRRDERGAC